MRFVTALTIVGMLAMKLPLAQANERTLVDGWVAVVPDQVEFTRTEGGGMSAQWVVPQLQSGAALASIFYSQSNLLPRSKQQAVELLHERVDGLVDAWKREPANREVRVEKVLRCDRADIVGLEYRLTFVRAAGEARLRGRIFYEGGRFVVVHYLAAAVDYSARHAQLLLDSLRNPELEARAADTTATAARRR